MSLINLQRATILAACGWSKRSDSSPLSSSTMTCHWCSRIIGLWNFDCGHHHDQQQQQQQQLLSSFSNFAYLHSPPLCAASAVTKCSVYKTALNKSPAAATAAVAAAASPLQSSSFHSPSNLQSPAAHNSLIPPLTPPLPLFQSPTTKSPSPIGVWIKVIHFHFAAQTTAPRLILFSKAIKALLSADVPQASSPNTSIGFSFGVSLHLFESFVCIWTFCICYLAE
jgi:hypothetical protein